MRNHGDLTGLDIVIISETPDPDSDLKSFFEDVLDEDLSEFFFNAKVSVLTEE